MLRHKSTIKLTELQKYFSSEEKAIDTLFRVLGSLKMMNRPFHAVDKVNTQYCGKRIFMVILLFPLFAVKDISHFSGS